MSVDITLVIVEKKGKVPAEWVNAERLRGLVALFEKRGTSRPQFYTVGGSLGDRTDPTHRIEARAGAYHVLVIGPPWLQEDRADDWAEWVDETADNEEVPT